jgi:hypothetical protein
VDLGAPISDLNGILSAPFSIKLENLDGVAIDGMRCVTHVEKKNY